MLFSSLPFLFGFLPVMLATVWLVRRMLDARAAVLLLLAGSLVFYAWQTPVYIFLILASILINHQLGRQCGQTRSKALLAFGVGLNLAALVWFKYIGLFSHTLSDLTHLNLTIDGVVLPLAISFFTFQQIAYLVDCHTEGDAGYGLVDYALFVAFFPQLIAGPIVHHKDLAPQFASSRFARFDADDVAAGLFLLAMGLSKKLLLADSLAPMADQVFNASSQGGDLPMITAWAGTLAYTFQIYFDFSGYSDMAIGLGLLFGVRLPMNFDSPYKSRSIIEFWRRWHMTLSQFLRDYLYFPLGGNRKGAVMRYRNLFIVMLLGGLWHGSAWTFMIWGGLHGAYLCINHALNSLAGEHVKRAPPWLGVGVTFLAAALAWVFFRADSFGAAIALLSNMFGLAHTGQAAQVVLPSTGPLLLALAAIICWRAPNSMEWLDRIRPALPDVSRSLNWPRAAAGAVVSAGGRQVFTAALGACCAISVFVLIASGPYEFIYFQF